jgi:RsiW-degrading membrane proteinase PrsW (M82 family)
VYFQDKYSREPTLTLFIAFLLGIVSVAPAVGIELFYEYAFQLTSGINLPMNFIYAFVGVGLTEEFASLFF